MVLRSVIGIGGFREAALCEVFGHDLNPGSQELARLLNDLGVGTRFEDYNIPSDKCMSVIDAALAGERGKNVVGEKEKFIVAA